MQALRTTRVANTKSSSFRPQLGRLAMSPSTLAVTPMTCAQVLVHRCLCSAGLKADECERAQGAAV